jgi:CHAT domain-containing protein/Tfp pilus assembly protein PilF
MGVTKTTHGVRPARDRRPWGLSSLFPAIAVLAMAHTVHARASSDPCFDRLSDGYLSPAAEWRQPGSTVERREIPPAFRGHPLFLRVEGEGVDVSVQVLDGTGAPVAQSDSPVERGGSQYLFLPAGTEGATLVATTNEPASAVGIVHVSFRSADAPGGAGERQDCVAALHKWAEGDMAYGRGRAVTMGRVAADAGVARAAYQTAADAYKEALKSLDGLAHTSERGELELALAAASYYGLKNWNESASWAKSAASTFADTHEPYRQARAEAIEAAAWIELATKSAGGGQNVQTPGPAKIQLSAARALLLKLAEFHASRHEEYDRALQINNVGLTYLYEGRFEPAIPYFSQAAREFKRLGDPTHAALALQNIALCDWGAGRLSAALTKFDRALELMPANARPSLYLITLSNSGVAHYAAGHFDESLLLQTQALDLATRLQSDLGRERSDYGLGVAYYAIGDRDLSAEFLRHGLDIATPELDARTRVAMLRALAQIEYDTGHPEDAIRHDSEALRLATASSARARILLRLAQDYLAQGDAPAARRILDELISHPPEHDELVRAMALVQRGHLLHTAGSNSSAEGDLLLGIETLDRLDALAERFDASVELARVYADEGRTAEALQMLRRALRYSREIRGQTANPEYRASIVSSLRPALSLEVDLLYSQFSALKRDGRHTTAQAVAQEGIAAVDRERALGFEEWRAEYFEQHSDTELAHLLSSSTALYRDMAERRYQLAVRQDRGGTDDSRARTLREEIARLKVQLGVINSEIARRSGGVKASSYIPHEATLANIEHALEPGHAAAEYWLGTSRSYAWVLRSHSIDWIELPPTEEIDHAARSVYEVMHSSATARARREACAKLYRLVFEPLRSVLGGVTELSLVPDGSLHYVPFSPLRESASGNGAYLIQAYDLSIAPALRFVPQRTTETAPRHGEPAVSKVLIVADPIYTHDDPRVNAGSEPVVQAHPVRNDQAELRGALNATGLARLESSAREASQIRALFGAERVDLLQGADATRDAVLAKDLGGYQFIHLASHGVIDSEIPQLSALILGTYGRRGPVTDPYLRAGDLLTRTFHAQAVVLSACDTALGKEYGSEGLVGLRYAALARGAHAVVASLWPVSDGIAARLMTEMYQGILASDDGGRGSTQANGREVARALAAAMRKELARAPELDPALWAPFSVYVGGD